MNANFNDDQINQTPIDLELDKAQIELQEKEDAAEVEIEELLKTLNIDSRRDERIIAFYFVYAVDRCDYTASLESVADNFSRGYNLTVPKTSYAFKIANGTIENRNEIDEKIKPYLKNWKLERLGCCTLLIIRMAMWELEQTGTIASIVINEAVELAKIFAEKDAFKFVNGLLDEYCKKNGLKSTKFEGQE
ncbi:MAG: N utilization substance protein B-like protein [candidate division TM6 bacterium GW2011_GWF2_37_49]|nr:MAG: N utilization substance protein B-like protein [candidate division TM6 bacterium GW2011_GWF2_37_49]